MAAGLFVHSFFFVEHSILSKSIKPITYLSLQIKYKSKAKKQWHEHSLAKMELCMKRKRHAKSNWKSSTMMNNNESLSDSKKDCEWKRTRKLAGKEAKYANRKMKSGRKRKTNNTNSFCFTVIFPSFDHIGIAILCCVAHSCSLSRTRSNIVPRIVIYLFIYLVFLLRHSS